MSNKRETVSKKSAAEFFSEHQQIAGFDNPGKSLFTTIRELVENSLDAAESIHILPEIEVKIEEYSELQHNKLNGIFTGDGILLPNVNENEIETGFIDVSVKKKGSKKATDQKDKDQMYYVVTCTDNGCGIAEDNIGDMLGRVLSGSKHGIRQTRGKFGLGAKMALIWSKKSSGLPIRIRTAHSTNPSTAPAKVTSVSLDIDIYKNEPKILSKQSRTNADGWRGTEISVTIAGNWSNYRSKVLQYFQQLAVITPYARLTVDFTCDRDATKSFRADFERRSEQMPPTATEIDPHPRSLNNITLSNLLQSTKCTSVERFLSTDLSGVSSTVASRIVDTLGIDKKTPKNLSSAQVAALLQLLRDEKQIRPPIFTCLSPAGEYNMRLGVLKELKPRMVATFSDKPNSVEGHPFLVEAAVSIGGTQLREGINVYRFANRIPLLFEAGADVVTQVATKRINWSSYHIDVKKDPIGVYVSIVSTRIPFKGTSKEYVGDDVKEIQASVRRALQGCCQQLRVNLAKSLAQREEKERRKTLMKYIPAISSSLITVLEKMRDKSELNAGSSSSSSSSSTSNKRKQSEVTLVGGDNSYAKHTRLLKQLSDEVLTEESLVECLTKGVDKFELDATLHASFTEGGGGGDGDNGNNGGNSNSSRVKLFLVPTSQHICSFPLPSSVVCVNSNSDMKDKNQIDTQASESFYSVTASSCGGTALSSPNKWTSLSQLSDISLSQSQSVSMSQQKTGSIFDLTVDDLQPLQRVSRVNSTGTANSVSRKSQSAIVALKWMKLLDTTNNSVGGTDSIANDSYILVNC